MRFSWTVVVERRTTDICSRFGLLPHSCLSLSDLGILFTYLAVTLNLQVSFSVNLAVHCTTL